MHRLRVVLLLAGGALLLVLLARLGPRQVLASLAQVGWYVLPVFLLYAAYQAARAEALRACVARRGLLPYGDALAIRLSGEAVQSLTFAGPVVAEPTRAWLLTRHGLSLNEGFAATITEYLISMFVTAAIAGLGFGGLLWRFDPAGPLRGVAIGVVAVSGAFLAVSAVAIGARVYLIGAIIAGLGRAGLLRGRLRPDVVWITQMEDRLLAVLRARRCFAVLALEIAAQVCLLLELLTVLRALGAPVGMWVPVILEAASKTASFLFVFVPLQVGVSEGAYAVIFEAIGLTAATGVAVALLRRLRSLAVASAGLAILARLSRPA